MADIAPVPASVLLVSGSVAEIRAGGTVTAGAFVYRATDGDYEVAKADANTTDAVEGIALCGASNGQPLTMALPGSVVNMGATLSIGKVYALSDATAGAMMPVDDISNNEYVTQVGVALTAANLSFYTIVSNVLAAASVT